MPTPASSQYLLQFPANLPISAHVDEIKAALNEHQVLVVAGETGSGKSTQLPKIALAAGRGRGARIGHTQPRRIAARAIAERLAEETRTTLGDLIGYQVRFTDQVGPRTQVKVMTDGILLAEVGRDRLLKQYDTIIIDEAHERSLNIDFLLGYLRTILPRRPDLKVIITSATIDVDRFRSHFGDAPGFAVGGRMFPVEIRYRPFGPEHDGDDQRDQIAAVCDGVEELCREPIGDILVFLAGEREIRDTADALAKMVLPGPGPVEIVPLFSRLSAAEQHRVFAAHQGRRVVLATNIAETSLTVPGVRYVVDAGTARISRFSARTKVQRLPIEPISQASANQRAGRCGRVADGVCIRLYDEPGFHTRPEYTDPEIVRTNLAAVLLQMAALSLGNVDDFPFLDPPDSRHVRSGEQLLTELGALSKTARGPRLTRLGRKIARFGVDPRVSAMILAAGEQHCLAEVLPIAAALSIQDPRERPTDRAEAAAAAHRRFADPHSDFLALLNLWRHVEQQRSSLSSSAFRRMCRREFLNFLRIREWQDLVGQLRRTASEVGLSVNQHPAKSAAIHQALLAGLLSHVGTWDRGSRTYLGARGSRFVLSRSSALAKSPPQWVVVAELVETVRLFGHTAAAVDPDAIAAAGQHMLSRQYGEPEWDERRAVATVRVQESLLGLPLGRDKRQLLSRTDPGLAREIFVREALVAGRWRSRHKFLRRNAEAMAEVRAEEDRIRRRDLLVEDEVLVDWLLERIGHEVVSGQHFDTWWKDAGRQNPRLLDYPPELLRAGEAATLAAAQGPDSGSYPISWLIGDQSLRLRYRFDPGAQDDGVSIDVPLSLLPQLSEEHFSWQVPGMREELVVAMLRSLPKKIRRQLVPIPQTAEELLPALDQSHGSLAQSLSRALRSRDLIVDPQDFDLATLPSHLRPTFVVLDDRPGRKRRRLASGTDLSALRES